MALRKKLALLFTLSLLGITTLSGCSFNNSAGNSTGNVEGEPYAVLANKNARKALTLAIDNSQISDVILNNGSKSISYVVAENLAFTEDGTDYRKIAGEIGVKSNDEEAKKAWEIAKEEVGFDTITLELLSYDSESSRRISEFIQSELQELEGLKVEIKQQPLKQKLALEASGDFHLTANGWGADYPDPLTYLSLFVTGNQYADRMGYSNPEYDKLIKEAMNAPTSKESFEKFAVAEKFLLEESIVIPEYQSGKAYLLKDYVKDIALYTYGSACCYKWADVDKDKKDLNLTTSGDIPSLDVSKATDAASFEVTSNTMEGLVRMDKEYKATPGMAQSWEQSEDGLTWTFNIRKDAKWSNGDSVTAHDFEYSWKRTLNPETASEYAYVMYDIVGAEDFNTSKNTDANSVGVKAIDDYTLEVKLNRRVNYFDQLMAFSVFFPQNKKVVEAQGDTYGTTLDSVVYNGPFTLSNWKIEDQFTFSKNPNYWDKDTVKLDNVNFKIVKDGNAALNLYETGEIDMVGVSSENADKYKDSPEFNSYKESNTYFIMINMKGLK